MGPGNPGVDDAPVVQEGLQIAWETVAGGLVGCLPLVRGYPVTLKLRKLLLRQEVSTEVWQQGCPRCASPTLPT